MKTHTFKITDATTFKELGLFINENKIMQDDKIIIDINVSYNFDFIFRRVLFVIIREGVSVNRQATLLNRLPASKHDDTYFFDDVSLRDALMEEAGVEIVFN